MHYPNNGNNTFSFEDGQHFRKGTAVFRIVRRFGDKLELQHAANLDTRLISVKKLISLIHMGDVIPCEATEGTRLRSGDQFLEDDIPVSIKGAVSQLSDAARRDGLLAIKYIQKLRELGVTSFRPTALLDLKIKQLCAQFGDSYAPKSSTLYKKVLAIQRSGGNLAAAFPRYAERGGRGKSRLHPAVQAPLNKIIDAIRDDPRAQIKYAPIEKQLYAELRKEYGNDVVHQIMPSSSSIARRVSDSFDAYEICKRKYGKKVADSRFRQWTPRDRAQLPLEVVEFDDKDTRVFAIDERTGLPAGRIFVTAGIDQATGVLLGSSMSDQPRNTWSALNALANCALPKDLSGPDWRHVRGDVPFGGTMGIALFDNALYNHAAALQAGAIEICNCAVAWATPYRPEEKSVIEDFNGRMDADFLSKLPGYLGPKGSKDRIIEGLNAANVSLSEFKQCFNAWAYDVYCNTPRASGFTPRQRWDEEFCNRSSRFPTNVRNVIFAAMQRTKRRLRPEHVLLDGLIYQSPRIQLLRRRLGHNVEVEIRYHPDRLDQIYVLDPEQLDWFPLSSANPEYTRDLTFYQHKLIRKKAREDGKHNPSIDVLVQGRNDLARLVTQLRSSKKLKERRLAKRVDGTKPLDVKESVSHVTMTELEAKIAEIDAVELDNDEEGWTYPTYD